MILGFLRTFLMQFQGKIELDGLLTSLVRTCALLLLKILDGHVIYFPQKNWSGGCWTCWTGSSAPCIYYQGKSEYEIQRTATYDMLAFHKLVLRAIRSYV